MMSFLKIRIFLLGSLLAALHLSANPSMEQEPHLIIQNRILAKVHNSTISVLDVVKHMEVFLNKHYPEYANSLPAKYQYFSAKWKENLMQMIDEQLILADADKMELKVTDSEVRETLFGKFGPNVMATLDKLGITYEEARSMIHSELTVQRMTWFKVHSKALASVNIPDVKTAYVNYREKNPLKEHWEYQILSIKAENEEIAKNIAEEALKLSQNSTDLSKISQELGKQVNALLEIPEESPPPFTLTLSEPVKAEDKNLSLTYKEILKTLSAGSISEPIKQTTKNGAAGEQNSVYRIFHLIGHTKTPTPTFRSMQDKLHDKLIQEAIEKESRYYISKLRERYGFDAKNLEENIPTGFQPFSLQ